MTQNLCGIMLACPDEAIFPKQSHWGVGPKIAFFQNEPIAPQGDSYGKARNCGAGAPRLTQYYNALSQFNEKVLITLF